MPLRTVDDIIRSIRRRQMPLCDRPVYTGGTPTGVALAVESMKRHSTDEGWQIMQSLESVGYRLHGYGLDGVTNARVIVDQNPGVVVVQDKREWDVSEGDFREPKAKFDNITFLKEHSQIFKLTILKDSQHDNSYHKLSADEMGVHAWIIYYHPAIVQWLSPFVRPEHLIRTYHSLDKYLVPEFSMEGRQGCFLSGATAPVYPLRQRLIDQRRFLPQTTYLPHPGYHRDGCCTPVFLKTLSQFKVSICTSSIYGYALRKIFESVACGCVVITDLPTDEILPEIDSVLVRVPHEATVRDVAQVMQESLDNYDADKQKHFAELAKNYYDYRASGVRLVQDIEVMRQNYNRRKS